MLTIFTPAYNRAHTLERTYKSLCNQTSKDFYWIIIDDGSTDKTRELVEKWFLKDSLTIEKNEFVGFSKDSEWLKIHYVYKENGGMHTAHNAAYERINTELAVCIDSDDWMPADGVELIIRRWKKYGSDKYAGMIGLDMFEDGYAVGTCFPKNLHECKTYDLERKYGVIYDKKYVYRPDVIKKYLPYPVFPGEKYGTVNFIYQKIDHDYDMLCSNDVYCIVEYQPDGLSVNTYNQLKQSPKTRAAECNVHMKYQKYFIDRLKKAIQYVACSLLSKNKKLVSEASCKCLVLFALPFGVAYLQYLKRKKLRPMDISKMRYPLVKD